MKNSNCRRIYIKNLTKSLWVFFCFFLLSNMIKTELTAQSIDDTTIQWVMYLEPNDTIAYKVNQQKLKISGTDTTVSKNFSYDLTLIVLDTTGSKFKISATYHNFVSTQVDEITKQLLSISEGMKVIYEADGFGGFIEILNTGELIPQIKKSYDQVVKKMGLNKEIVQGLEPIMQRYATKEGLEGGGVDELHYLHGGIGYQYELGKEYYEDVQVANNLGGEPFDGTRTMKLLEIDSTERTAMLKIITDIDGEQLKEASVNLIKSLLPADKQKDFKADEVPAMFIQHRLVNFFDYDYGWNLYSYNIKEIEAGGVITQEITEIAVK